MSRSSNQTSNTCAHNCPAVNSQHIQIHDKNDRDADHHAKNSILTRNNNIFDEFVTIIESAVQTTENGQELPKTRRMLREEYEKRQAILNHKMKQFEQLISNQCDQLVDANSTYTYVAIVVITIVIAIAIVMVYHFKDFLVIG